MCVILILCFFYYYYLQIIESNLLKVITTINICINLSVCLMFQSDLIFSHRACLFCLCYFSIVSVILNYVFPVPALVRGMFT